MRSSRMRRATAAAVLTVAALAVASPASADPGGAEVVKVHECQVFGDATFCTDSHSVLSFTETPSGNISLKQHIRFDNSFTSPGCNSRDQGESRNHLLIKDATDHEFHFAFKIHSTFDCAGTTSDCVTSLHFHRVNGQIQFDRQETVCTDPI